MVAQVHGENKKIIIRNGAKTISLQTSFENLIIIIIIRRRRRRNGAKAINLQTSFGDLIIRNGANTICFPKLCLGGGA